MADCSRGMWAMSISAGAKALCALLWTYLDSIDGGVVWTSVTELARVTRQGPRTVKRQLAELKTAGLAERSGRGLRMLKAPRLQGASSDTPAGGPAVKREGPSATPPPRDEGPFPTPKRASPDQKGASSDTQGNQEGSKREKPPTPKNGGSRRQRNQSLVAKWRPQCEQVIARLNARRKTICEKFGGTFQPIRAGNANCVEIAKRLEDGETVQTLLAVVDAEARNCWKKRGADYRWLNPTTPFRDSNYPDRVAQVGAPRPAGEPLVLIATPEEAVAWSRAHGGVLPPGWGWDLEGHAQRQEVAS